MSGHSDAGTRIFLTLEYDANEGGQLIAEIPELGDGGFAVHAEFWPSLQYD